MFFIYRMNRLLQFPRSLKFKPSSSPYTNDFPSNLLFEAQGKVFSSQTSEKFYFFLWVKYKWFFAIDLSLLAVI